MFNKLILTIVLLVLTLYSTYQAGVKRGQVLDRQQAQVELQNQNPDFASLTLALVNHYRLGNNVPPLKLDEKFCEYANKRARQVVSYWSHEQFSQDSQVLYFRVCPLCGLVAENLARNLDTPEQVLQAWLASPQHQQNLANAAYNIGCVGVYQTYEGQYFVALEMGQK